MIRLVFFSFMMVFACLSSAADLNLAEAREGFTTTLVKQKKTQDVFDPPPEELLSIVQYPTELGPMSAYLTKASEPGKKYPAIIWVTGGFPQGGAGNSVWVSQPRDNDQSAKQYWQQDIISMYPSFRGTFGNPGQQEGFYDEVDDVLSAIAYLASLEHIDKQHIYLGGHSTGATLALLAAAASDQLKGVFAFGPVASPANYRAEHQLHDPSNPKENELRSPINFINGIQAETYIIEGVDGNIASLRELKERSNNAKVHFLPIEGADHFASLYPLNRLLAKQIREQGAVKLNQADAQAAYDNMQVEVREMDDLSVLSNFRAAGYALDKEVLATYYLISESAPDLKSFGKKIQKNYSLKAIEKNESSNGVYYVLKAQKKLMPKDLNSVFESSAFIDTQARENAIYYNGWTASYY